MKICMNGNVIDTDNIWQITNIFNTTFGWGNIIKVSFLICFFHDENLEVSIDVKATPEARRNPEKELARLSSTRDEIIAIWNQAGPKEIPVINSF